MILTIRVEETLHKALKSLADQDERKLSAYAARVLRAHARDAGRLGEAQDRATVAELRKRLADVEAKQKGKRR